MTEGGGLAGVLPVSVEPGVGKRLCPRSDKVGGRKHLGVGFGGSSP